MAWSRNRVDSSNINSGDEYAKGDRVSRQMLNAMVNSGLYSQDTVEGMGNSGTYSAGTTYKYPNIVTYNGSAYMAVYKSGGEYASFSGQTPTNTTYWKLLASGAVFSYNSSTNELTITTA